MLDSKIGYKKHGDRTFYPKLKLSKVLLSQEFYPKNLLSKFKDIQTESISNGLLVKITYILELQLSKSKVI